MFSAENLHAGYGSLKVLNGVSISVDEGEIVGILGPNGAGKTTTVESSAGLRIPDSGRIGVFGFDPLTDRNQVSSRLGSAGASRAERQG